jgi:uncharacterized damage-inducible protein DinB
MKILIGLENNIEGRSLAWALELPGCFAYGPDGPGAIIAMGQAVPAYAAWIAMHTEAPWFNPPNIDIRLVETFQDFFVDEALNRFEEDSPGVKRVNAWFFHDWKPLTAEEVERALQMLSWSRTDLLALTAGLTSAQLDQPRPGERWSIRGILGHVANAEWRYLDRLNLAECAREQLPADVHERLSTQRARLEAVLPSLVGVEQVIGRQGELWSPRKLVRRALWHEIDHIRHILGLLANAR